MGWEKSVPVLGKKNLSAFSHLGRKRDTSVLSRGKGGRDKEMDLAGVCHMKREKGG